MDLGILYKTNLRGLQLGASMSNFGTDMQLNGRDLVRPYDDDPQNFSNDKLNTTLKTDAFSLPLLFRFGISYNYELNDNNSFTTSLDLNHPSNNLETMNVGMEYQYRKLFALRAGYQSLFDKTSENGLTLGFGLAYQMENSFNVQLDYAYSNWGILGQVQRFSIEFDL